MESQYVGMQCYKACLHFNNAVNLPTLTANPSLQRHHSCRVTALVARLWEKALEVIRTKASLLYLYGLSSSTVPHPCRCHQLLKKSSKLSVPGLQLASYAPEEDESSKPPYPDRSASYDDLRPASFNTCDCAMLLRQALHSLPVSQLVCACCPLGLCVRKDNIFVPRRILTAAHCIMPPACISQHLFLCSPERCNPSRPGRASLDCESHGGHHCHLRQSCFCSSPSMGLLGDGCSAYSHF